MNRTIASVLVVLFMSATALAQDIGAVADHLQSISVTIKAGSGYNTSQGSGVIKTREVNGKTVNFVWTAAHVVDGLRKQRDVIDPKTGTKRTIVEFKDATIVKQLVENGRKVGQIEMDAEVVKYSDADDGHDIALLKVRKEGFINETVDFYLDDNILGIGTRLYHVGSLLGIGGANSMTDGILSQVGRVYPEINNKIFDQTTCHAFPGSSGGGVYLTDGRCSGILVRGAGESFNLVVPVRRLKKFAEEAGVHWALDDSVPVPEDYEEIISSPESIGVDFEASQEADDGMMNEQKFKFWLYYPNRPKSPLDSEIGYKPTNLREQTFRDHINLGVYNTGQ